MTVLGLDIGGANLKAAASDQRSAAEPFPLWKEPERLPDRLRVLISRFADCDQVAIVMTGELADCYPTKADGVRRIVSAVVAAAGARRVGFWCTAGRFLTSDAARSETQSVAAANWHALSTWAGRLAPTGSAVLIDIGTTTTDIIPLLDGRPCARGLTDPERLRSRELVYTGVRRTPLCALSPTAPWDDETIGVAAELFATSLDVYLLLGDIPENPADSETANGGPATRAAAQDRLARMVCGDRHEVNGQRSMELARWFAERQRHQIAEAVWTVIGRTASPVGTVITSGSGEFLARRVVAGMPELVQSHLISLGETLSPEVASAACALAVAQLATERMSW